MQQITSKELVNNNDKSILILDIRDSNSFNDWNIKGSQNIDVYKDIWEGNLDTVKQKLSDLPKDRKIVTVCNAGVTSQKASELLESLGYNTIVLEKGMMGWNTLHQAVDVINENDLLLKQIIRTGKGCMSYLIGSNSTKECFIVDPSQFVDEYTNLAKELGFTIKGVIETHVHADHLSGAKALADATKTKYYISGKDLKAKTADIKDIKELVNAMNKRDIKKISENIYNDFDQIIEKKFKIVGEIKTSLKKFDALNSLVSGSGPTVFGLFDSIYPAREAYFKLKDIYPFVYLTKTF